MGRLSSDSRTWHEKRSAEPLHGRGKIVGGLGRNRTTDAQIFSLALYRLSYEPTYIGRVLKNSPEVPSRAPWGRSKAARLAEYQLVAPTARHGLRHPRDSIPRLGVTWARRAPIVAEVQ